VSQKHHFDGRAIISGLPDKHILNNPGHLSKATNGAYAPNLILHSQAPILKISLVRLKCLIFARCEI
jgi:hypothetical protein